MGCATYFIVVQSNKTITISLIQLHEIKEIKKKIYFLKWFKIEEAIVNFQNDYQIISPLSNEYSATTLVVLDYYYFGKMLVILIHLHLPTPPT